MSRLLVAADLHLEKGTDYSADRLGEQEAVWGKVIRQAIEHECDAVLFAGDATEYRAPSSAARAAFQRPLVHLEIPVLAINGNHDVKHPRYPTALALMDRRLGGQLLTESHHPELLEVGGVIVATLPWTPMGTFKAHLDGAVTFERAAEELIAIAEGHALEALKLYPDLPRVLLGHWAIAESFTPSGKCASDFHEPVLPLAELQRLPFDAVIMGHVHKPQSWGNVLVPGSPLPLDFGEAACEHGCWVIDPDTSEPPEFLPIESRPFKTLDLDADAAVCLADGLTHLGGNEVADAVVRVRYTATEEQAAQISVARLRRTILEAGAHRVWQVSPTIERAARPRAAGMTAALTPMQAVDLWLEGREEAPEELRDRAQQIIEQVAP